MATLSNGQSIMVNGRTTDLLCYMSQSPVWSGGCDRMILVLS
nr:hypothetical protein [Arthrospira sp. SH-MAG29]